MKLGMYPEREEFGRLAGRGNLIPVCMDILADTETPLSALAKVYRGEGPVFLLESVEGGERWGRYSFLGASARASVRVYRDVVEIEEEGSTVRIEHRGDPLAVLRSLMARYKPVSLPGLPRFWGGMVGYLTYESVSFFENIPNTCSADEVLAQFVVPDQLFIFDNLRHTLTLVAYAFLDGADPERAYDSALEALEGMVATLERPLPTPAPLSGGPFGIKPVVSSDAFRSQVSRIKEYINEGDVIQTVISQPFVCQAPPDPWLLYRAQRYINPSPYLYFLHLGDTVLVGSSPETM
ncbi:MAG: chorismate-binding protein, partial [Acidobacteriota bacterium]